MLAGLLSVSATMEFWIQSRIAALLDSESLVASFRCSSELQTWVVFFLIFLRLGTKCHHLFFWRLLGTKQLPSCFWRSDLLPDRGRNSAKSKWKKEGKGGSHVMQVLSGGPLDWVLGQGKAKQPCPN